MSISPLATGDAVSTDQLKEDRATPQTELATIARVKNLKPLLSLCEYARLGTIADLKALEDRISRPDLPEDTPVTTTVVKGEESFLFPDRRVTGLSLDLSLLEDFDDDSRGLPSRFYSKTCFKIFLLTKHVVNENLYKQTHPETSFSHAPKDTSKTSPVQLDLSAIPRAMRSRSQSPSSRSCSISSTPAAL